jgi:hypothetical protein
MDTFDVDGDGSCDKEEFKSWFDGSVASVQFTFLDALCGTGLCRGSGVKFFFFFLPCGPSSSARASPSQHSRSELCCRRHQFDHLRTQFSARRR